MSPNLDSPVPVSALHLLRLLCPCIHLPRCLAKRDQGQGGGPALSPHLGTSQEFQSNRPARNTKFDLFAKPYRHVVQDRQNELNLPCYNNHDDIHYSCPFTLLSHHASQ